MHAPFSLADRSILVTGASSGIGRACAVAAAEAGARVLATGRDEVRLEETRAMLAGDGHRTVIADLASDAGIEVVAATVETVDGVVHAAGVFSVQPLKFLGREVLTELHRINVEAPLLLTRDLFRARKLSRGGSVVFVASVAPFIGAVGHVAYAASKGALIAASRVVAKELAVRQVRANCLCPGTVRTPLLDRLGSDAAALAADEKRYPLGYGAPEDVANGATFLLSDAGRWVTGTALVMDGGLLL